MKCIYLLFPLIQACKIIKNSNIPACRNCIHYKPSYYSTDYTSTFNECTKFAEKNIITDKIKYFDAVSCRYDESKCGSEGKYFEEDENVQLKVFAHGIITAIPNTMVGLSIILLLLLVAS